MMRHPAGTSGGWRALALGWVVALGSAFALAQVPDGFDPGLWSRNEQRWEQLPEARRAELRHAWTRFDSLPAARQELLIQRADMLRRVRAERAAAAPDAAVEEQDVLAALTQRADLARRTLQAQSSESIAEHGLARAVQVRAQRSLHAFFGHMVARGRIGEGERARLLQLGFREQAREGLLLLKTERLHLYSETPRVPRRDVEQLSRARSIEALQALARRRRAEGFLGKLGELLPLGQDARRVLAAAPDWDVERLLFERHRAAILRILEGLQQSPERCEQLLALPLNELERELHALLAGAEAAR